MTVVCIGLEGISLFSYTYTPVSRLALKALESRKMVAIPPIFDIGEYNDVSVFASQKDAERYIEATDLLQGNCLLFDSQGRHLSAVPNKQGTITILGTTTDSIDGQGADLLFSRLYDFLLEVGAIDNQPSSFCLEDLVKNAKAFSIK